MVRDWRSAVLIVKWLKKEDKKIYWAWTESESCSFSFFGVQCFILSVSIGIWFVHVFKMLFWWLRCHVVYVRLKWSTSTRRIGRIILVSFIFLTLVFFLVLFVSGEVFLFHRFLYWFVCIASIWAILLDCSDDIFGLSQFAWCNSHFLRAFSGKLPDIML